MNTERAPSARSSRPLVTVLMSVHNGRAFLREAVGSVLGQSLENLELIVFDDGSTDDSGVILASIPDRRLRVVRNERARGLTACLHDGVNLAGGRYLARLDADDVARQHRFAEQVAFLERRPGVGIVGSDIELIDEQGRHIGRRCFPRAGDEIRWQGLFINAFAHPAVMVRRAVLVEHRLNYDPSFRTAQDFDLWVRLLRFTRGANLGAPLTRYRVHGASVTLKRRDEQDQSQRRAGRRELAALLPEVDLTDDLYQQLQRVFAAGWLTPGSPWVGRRRELARLYLLALQRVAGGELHGALCRTEAAKLVRLALWPVTAESVPVVFKAIGLGAGAGCAAVASVVRSAAVVAGRTLCPAIAS